MDPLPAEGLKGIQNYLAGTFVLQNSTPQDVQRITSEYIRADDMTLVVVGDKKKVEEQIKDYATPSPEKK